MPVAPRRSRRLAGSLLSGLTGVALIGTSAMPTSATPDELEFLGTASELGIVAPHADELDPELAEDAIPGRYLVQVEGTPVAAGGSAASTEQARGQVVRAAQQEGIRLSAGRTYTAAWTGFAAELADADVDRLRSVPGVVGVFPVVEVERPAPLAAQPDMEYAVGMTGADVAQNELGLSGEGIKVGVIDSGIDYNHPDLGGSGTNDQRADFPNDRVIVGTDLVGDAYDASGENGDPTPKPDEFPDDCGGHGTHVAGIVGASGGITGVAPGVEFGAYRVFGCDGSSDTQVILDAMEAAYVDGMDVVNMSLGASFMTWPSYPTAQAVDTYVAAGQTYVISAGNSGTSGTFSSGAPGVAHDAITVASVDNTHYQASFFETTAGTQVPYSEATGSPAAPTSGTMDLVASGAPGSPALIACDPALVPEATGEDQALLIQRGTCSFHIKAVNAQDKGYAAAVLYNNTGGVINATVEGATPITIPFLTILQADGQALQAELAAGGTDITWSDTTESFENPTAGLVSDFSSYGLAADLTLKPDVAAPGGSISSTYPLEKGAEATLSGTSMAAPHTAGAAALLLEADPDLAPLDVRTALQNTADQLDWSLVSGAGYLEPVVRQGAGLIDIPQAVTSATKVETSKISLGEGEAGPVTTTLTVSNSGTEDVTYDLGATGGITVGGQTADGVLRPTWSPGFFGPATDVTFSAESVTVPAGGSATVDVTIADPIGDDGYLHGGWLTLSSATDTLSVPFAGISGDYQALPVLTSGVSGLPLPSLGVVVDGSLFLNDEPGYTYSMVGDDLPYVIYHLDYPVSQLELNVFKANEDGTKGEKVHDEFNNALTLTDLGRDNSYAVVAWDGTFQGNYGKGNDKTRTVADGDYVLEVSVLRALGDAGNPDHWESWSSPAFTVERGEGADTGAGNGPKPGKGGR